MKKMKIDRGGLWFFILSVLFAALLLFLVTFFLLKPKIDRQIRQLEQRRVGQLYTSSLNLYTRR